MNYNEETIRTSTDLENNYDELSRLCNNEGKTVIITSNGKEDIALFSYDEYKRMKARIEILEVLAESEDDVKNGRVKPAKDTYRQLRKELMEM